MNKYKLFLFSLILTNPLISQEIDQSFLETLPESIRQDVSKKALENVDSEKAVYRSSLYSSKVEKETDLIDADLFGADFFSTFQSSFMPINEPNLDATYELDFGDEIEIQLIGKIDSIEKYLISRDGSINIPEIGKIKLSGLTMQEANALIKNKISSAYIGTEVFITLSNIRDISVLVSGNSFNPGIYTLSGNSNILHAINVAGGINEYGSYRTINLIRENEIVETLDLYDVLITGKVNIGKRLRTGDVVFVEAVKNIVSVNGAVKRPLKYELIDGEKLHDALDYANGLSNDADLNNISLDRIINGAIESLPIDHISQFKEIDAEDGDKVFIRKHSFREVSIKGSVLKPGTYLMKEGDRASDLIKKAGGYTTNAYPFGAVYSNKQALEVSSMAKKVLYEEFLDNIISLSQKSPDGNIDLTSMIEITDNFKNSEPNGRIIVDLKNSGDNSIFLKDGDELIIPERPYHVFIFGEVSSEGAVLFDSSDNNIDSYIRKTGGFKSTANKKSIYILHPNGEVERISVNRNIFANQDSINNFYPGSVIFVPRKIDNSALNRMTAQAYAGILGNIGVTLASLSVLDK